MFAARAEAPRKLEVGRSSEITASLIPTGGGSLPAIALTPGNTVVVGTAIVVGTPGAPLPEAFGGGYRARARAVLDVTEFNRKPESQEYRDLTDRRLDWRWSVSSNSPGSQLLLLAIDVEWVPTTTAGAPITERVWTTNLRIEVTKPFISLGQLQIGTIFGGVIGSGLSVPFLYGLLKERRKKQEPPPPAPPSPTATPPPPRPGGGVASDG